MVHVTQASKARNDPLGTAFSHIEWTQRPATAAPQRPRSHYIGMHLRIPPRLEDPLEERAMRRAVDLDARLRRTSRQLAEAEDKLAAATDEQLKRDQTIEALKAQLTLVQHALDVAQARVWRPDHTNRPTLAAAPAAPTTGGTVAEETGSSQALDAALIPLDAGGGLRSLVAASLLQPLGARAHNSEAQRRLLVALGDLGRIGGAPAVAAALRDGGLLERVSERLLPLLLQQTTLADEQD
jgi:hypothetical protein